MSASATCPSCGEPRADAARACAACGFDFTTPPSAPLSLTPPPPSAGAIPTRWEVVLTVDPSLDTDPDPALHAPVSARPRVVAIDRTELLVGRHDEHRDIHPEIPLHDPGASRRHAKLVVDSDGAIALQDLASTNGTSVNGKPVPPGTRRRLADGDVVTIGRWSRLALRRA